MLRPSVLVAVLLRCDLVVAIRSTELAWEDGSPEDGSLTESLVQGEDKAKKVASPKTPFSHWFSRHNFIIDASSEEQKLREIGSDRILQADEHIEVAFKVGADKTFLTNKRMILRWKKLFSPRAEYKSIPYSAIKAWSIETTGRWPDMATRLRVWTSTPGGWRVWKAFRKGKANIFGLNQFMGAKLGIPATSEQPISMTNQEFQQGVEDFWSWWGGDHVQVDAAAVQEKLQSASTPFLGKDETVQQAFQVGGDMFLFTSHRIVNAEVMGRAWQRSIRYISIPWSCVQAYMLQTAGGWIDNDLELKIWTDIYGMRSISKDLRRGRVDTKAILEFLNGKVLKLDGDGNATRSDVAPAPQSKWGDMMAWLGNDFSKVDPAEAEALVRNANPGLLLDDEKVELGYRVYRDSFLLTNRRVLLIDGTKWIFSKPKFAYTTVPYSSIRAFSTTTSSGSWDRDSEFCMFTRIPRLSDEEDGHARLRIDMRRGRANITEIQEYMAAKLFGPPAGDSCGISQKDETERENFWDWILGDSKEIDAKEAQDMFCRQGVLQPGEIVAMAFRLRRDFTLYTNKRLVIIDKHVLVSRRVTIRSLPYSSLRFFDVKSAGGWLDRDHDLRVFTDLPAMSRYRQEFRKGKVDIFKIQKALMERVAGTGLPGSLLQTTDLATQIVNHISASASLAASEQDGAISIRNFVSIDTEAAEKQLRDVSILQDDEHAVMAFEVWRDRVVMTQKRMIFRAMPPLGKRVRYQTIPFSSVKIFAIQTGGRLDGHMEMGLWLDSPGLRYWGMNFKRGKADIFKVGSYWNEHVLGIA